MHSWLVTCRGFDSYLCLRLLVLLGNVDFVTLDDLGGLEGCR